MTACIERQPQGRNDCLQVWNGRFMEAAYRVVYREWHGPIEDGLEIHHTCENRRCVHPDHLVQVTRRQHLLIHRSGRLAPCGHPYDSIEAGRRRCRRCRNERHRIAYARRRLGV